MISDQTKETASVLAIVAHPDDVDIVAGGTIAQWVLDGERIHYCIVSYGEAGSPSPDMPLGDTASIRRLEQERAATRLGVQAVHFLGLPDSQIQLSLDLRLLLARMIRQLRPQKIVTHAPLFNLRSIRFSHPDHLAVGQAALAAVFPDARNPHAFTETDLVNLEPHIVSEVWMMGAPTPNTYVDITKQIDVKIEAILCHTSQVGEFGDIRDFFYTWGRELASDAGFSDAQLAEAFYVMDTR
jgi:LmbE family N-acetylglucosaminyl deacetylase